MQQTRAAAPATLDAVLERITYANQETGYTVARVATARSSDLLTVIGPLLGAQPGESLRLQGRWTSHPQHCRAARGVLDDHPGGGRRRVPRPVRR
jgi:exodeoxyribonuclease V alpha subunit